MENYKKYLKYKNKYLELKKKIKQTGGTFFISIPNGGGQPGVSMSSQCIWICIKDYLNYHRGIITTVRELKSQVGLGPETDHQEYNHEDYRSRTALIRLCEIYDITLHFIFTNHDGTIRRESLDEYGEMRPFESINRGTQNNLYVASYGAHFELIIFAPNYALERHQRATIQGQEYHPKVLINNEFIEPSRAHNDEERQKIAAMMELVDTTQLISILEEDLRRIESEIEYNRRSIKNLKNSTLTQEENEMLAASYYEIIRTAESQMSRLMEQLVSLNQQKSSLELIIQ
jgi:hypothetical protein